MSKIISVDALGKKYLLRHQAERYSALRDVITRKAVDLGRRFRGGSRAYAVPTVEEFWALRDVNFDVAQGDRVGIIGRNGAGKSTLLKILSRVTEPSTGKIRLRGRMASLLEVGTGFHPELTGRENIYLNGAILGMNRAEIRRKFDEIVAFAEVEKFLDTPVKRYSSGMYVRLAFAVAVQLEPEILIVDEVLAVGDAQFQKKCFARLQTVGSQGRTILFVSHNLAAVRTICQSGIALERGRVAAQGKIDEIVDGYLAGLSEDVVGPQHIEMERFFLENVEITSTDGHDIIKTFDDVNVCVSFRAKVDVHEPGVYVGFLTLENERIAGLDFRDLCEAPRVKAGDVCELSFTIKDFPFLAGEYQLEIHLKDVAVFHIERVPHIFQFSVIETPVYGGRKLDSWFGHVGLDAIAHARAAAMSASRRAGRR
jgi:lipopolysaccharide transport system ATP-binding protein